MADRGKTCGDCAKLESARQPAHIMTQSARHYPIKRDHLEDFEPTRKAKNKPKPHKICGLSDQGYFEAIYNESKPAFLVVK